MTERDVLEEAREKVRYLDEARAYGITPLEGELQGLLADLADALAESRAALAQRDAAIQQVREAIRSLADTLAFSTRDWSTSRDLAWLWGVLQGWDDDDPECDAMSKQAAIHGWDDHEVARLRQLHAAVTLILDQKPQS